ncbi:hypothetical protein EJ03DRAFT_182301 [Teratosphaeria nubilosa]|uniref:Uncharacterized protein n=1 Tax=Teratosphaeria nubilosa TaxID=161662 RepID=A0A6G1L088_9PEZI|nr:hypothetical protein EJ03DRAFT_182301 [Teratosphaeria nubilosa]
MCGYLCLLVFLCRSCQGPNGLDTEYDIKVALDAAYNYALALSALFWWPPVLASITAVVWPGRIDVNHTHQLHPASLMPPYPSRKLKATNIAEGAKWLISWDNTIGLAAVTVWEAQLLVVTNDSAEDESSLSLSSMTLEGFAYALLAGPMAIPIFLLKQRDLILLGYS